MAQLKLLSGMANRKLRVGIACNIRKGSTAEVGARPKAEPEAETEAEAEFDDPETVGAIRDALQSGRLEVGGGEADDAEVDRIVADGIATAAPAPQFNGIEASILEADAGFLMQLQAFAPDIVFNIAEGRTGRSREAQIPALMEYYGIPYTGSDATALAVSLDKAMTKRIAQSCGLQTPGFCVITQEAGATAAAAARLPRPVASPHATAQPADQLADLTFPLLVKPNAEGSSKAIADDCVAESPSQLRALLTRQKANTPGDLLVEEYIDGREFTVGILGHGAGLRVLEPMEVVYRQLRGAYKIYSLEVKRHYHDYISYACPPDLPAPLASQLKDDAQTIYTALGCRDLCRLDFRLSTDGQLFFIEANPLPGLAPGYSDLPIMAAANGIAYSDLILAVLASALQRYGMKAVQK